MELVPSEIERLLLPVVGCTAAQLAAADEKYRKAENNLAFLRGQDVGVLGKIGVSKADRDVLYNAWLRLRGRRQRTAVTHGQEETEQA